MAETSDKRPISPERHAELQRLLTSAEPGTAVFDSNGQAIGVVKAYDITSGYVTIGKGGIFARALAIPCRLITRVEEEGAYLAKPEDALTHDFAQEPAIRLTVARAPVPGAEEKMALYELHWRPSGYDGSPVVVDRVALNDFGERLAVGMAVHAPDGQRHGVISENDDERRLMVVERGNVFHPTLEDIPYDDIAQIDLDAQTVLLTTLRHARPHEDSWQTPQPPAELATQQPGAQESTQTAPPTETTDNPHP